MDIPKNTVSSIQEDGKSEMVAPRMKKKKKKMLQNYFDSLPDDMLMQILIRIPAQDIVDATMAVCRKWHETIRTHNFQVAHLHHSTSGLLLSSMDNTGTTLISVTPDQIEISDFSYNFIPGLWSCCNGLILEVMPNDTHELMITNPVTKKHFLPPPFIVRNQYPVNSSAIAYVAARMEYKVVRRSEWYSKRPQSRICCAILTVGVDDSWRLVDIQHLSDTATLQLLAGPLVTEGFVHWAGYLPDNNYVLTLNMETEIFTQIPVPQCNDAYHYDGFHNHYYKYLSSGENYLSLLIGRGYLKWEVWEMKPETGEWTKLLDIDLESHKGVLNESCYVEEGALKPGYGDCLDCKLQPAGWLKYREIIVFVVLQAHELGAAYNVKTRDLSVFVLGYNYNPYLIHKNSLVRIQSLV